MRQQEVASSNSVSLRKIHQPSHEIVLQPWNPRRRPIHRRRLRPRIQHKTLARQHKLHLGHRLHIHQQPILYVPGYKTRFPASSTRPRLPSVNPSAAVAVAPGATPRSRVYATSAFEGHGAVATNVPAAKQQRHVF